jgi:glyoxylase-like metal-dependent hydrolase (beta-lactamase superfamily II)
MASNAPLDFTTGPVHGNLNVHWIHGSPSRNHSPGQPFQVHAYDQHTYILRQNKAASAEAPFLYLLFGNDRALLLDTGAGKQTPDDPLRTTIDDIVSLWLDDHPRDGYELVVAHTHGHHDHTAGDRQFVERPVTLLVGSSLAEVEAFFGFTSWPDQTVKYDLGGRVLEIVGTPGHHPSAITVYDPWSGFLLTGDNVLPGRIFAFDFPAFLASIERTVAFASRRRVTHVLGCHIEMTRRPGRDYPLGCTYQPDEPPLQMTLEQLTAVRDAARSIAGKPGAHTFDDFLIMNGPPRRYIARLIARAVWAKIRQRAGSPWLGS